MKYFAKGGDIIGSATAAKRYLKEHPEVETLERWWWSGNDLIECEDYSREQILGKTARKLTEGQTCQWTMDHWKWQQVIE